MFFLQQFNSEKSSRTEISRKNNQIANFSGSVMLAMCLDSRDSDPKKVTFHSRTNKLSKFCVSRNLSNMLLLTLERTSCYLLWEKKICRTVYNTRGPKIFCVKIQFEERKKSIKIKITFPAICLSLFLTRVLLQRGWELPHHHNDQGYSLSRWIGQVGAARDIQVLVRYRCPVLSVRRANLLAEVRKLDL